MQGNDDNLTQRLREIIQNPGEQRTVDYKEAALFDGKSDFSLKLIKHIIGMANAGGGVIVIGIIDGNWKPDPNLTQAIIESYNQTKLSEAVSSVVQGEAAPKVTIYYIDGSAGRHPVIVTDDFSQDPFFCKSGKNGADGKPILKQNALYYRTDHANTLEVTHREWVQLITRCVAKRQSQMLDAFSTVLREVTSGEKPSTQRYSDKFRGIVERELRNAQKIKNGETRNISWWWFWHYPSNPLPVKNSQELRDIIDKSYCRHAGWYIGAPTWGSTPDTVGDDGISLPYNSGYYWFLQEQGLFFQWGYDPYDINTVHWIGRLGLMTEALVHCSKLYHNLGYSLDEPITFQIVHDNLKGKELIDTEGRHFLPRPLCSIAQVACPAEPWTGSLASLDTRLTDIVVELCVRLFDKFNGASLSKDVLQKTTDDLKTRFSR